MKKFIAISFILIFSIGFKVKADEGMWLLPLIEKLNMGKMTEMGLKLSAEDIYSLNKACLKDAIVIFGGGCTGEIVSSRDSSLQTIIADMGPYSRTVLLNTIISGMDSGQRARRKNWRIQIFL